MIAVIDNYDSFTFNLVQMLRNIGGEICLYRNDEITVEELVETTPKGILISPVRQSDFGRNFMRGYSTLCE